MWLLEVIHLQEGSIGLTYEKCPSSNNIASMIKCLQAFCAVISAGALQFGVAALKEQSTCSTVTPERSQVSPATGSTRRDAEISSKVLRREVSRMLMPFTPQLMRSCSCARDYLWLTSSIACAARSTSLPCSYESLHPGSQQAAQ